MSASGWMKFWMQSWRLSFIARQTSGKNDQRPANRACVFRAPEHVLHERQFMTAQQLLADIHALETELLGFERKYGIRSEIFFPAFIAGDEPENDAWVLDFGEWASVYRTWLTRQAEYRNEIERTQPEKGSLAGLIHVSA
jgi:hypothetical protein